MNWDDVRFFLALARNQTVRGTASALGTSHSTVLRRVAALETSLGARLFHRQSRGYVLTAAGERARDVATQLEESMLELRRQVQGADERLSGPVRVSTSPAFLKVLLEALPAFIARYPGIHLEFAAPTHNVDLTRGEADIAVRIAASPDPNLVGRCVGRVGVGVYGSRAYADRVDATTGWRELDWLNGNPNTFGVFASWITEHVEPSQIRLRLSGVLEMLEAISAGLGVTLLPAPQGDADPMLHCFHRIDELSAPVWVLSHSDLRTTARVRVVRAFIGETIGRAAPLLMQSTPVAGAD